MFNRPPLSLRPYRGVSDSIGAMLDAAKGKRGHTAPLVRLAAEQIVRRVTPKDYLSEVLAIKHWVNKHVPYVRDPVTVEWVRDPVALLEQVEKHGVARADCDEIALLMACLWMSVGNRSEFVTVGFEGPRGVPTHVLARCFIPKSDVPIVCDPVAGTREPKMLQSVRALRVYPIG